VVEQTPRLEGKQMFMIIGPNPKVAQRARDAQKAALQAMEKEKEGRKLSDKGPGEKSGDAKASAPTAEAAVLAPAAAPAVVAEAPEA
jgi:translation initiation factor IF-3